MDSFLVPPCGVQDICPRCNSTYLTQRLWYTCLACLQQHARVSPHNMFQMFGGLAKHLNTESRTERKACISLKSRCCQLKLLEKIHAGLFFLRPTSEAQFPLHLRVAALTCTNPRTFSVICSAAFGLQAFLRDDKAPHVPQKKG